MYVEFFAFFSGVQNEEQKGKNRPFPITLQQITQQVYQNSTKFSSKYEVTNVIKY